ncbi:MAG: phosphomethylpyrimidine synthase ThiC [Candidatus Micrarchaeia archaeon]
MSLLFDAKKRKSSETVKAAAKTEKMPEKKLLKLVAEGFAVLPSNNRRKNALSCAIGKNTRTKINANLGCSPGFTSIKKELEKAKVALEFGADALMDLSTTTKALRRKLLKLPVPLGTVPVYDVLEKKGKNASSDDFFNSVRDHCRQGVDFVTVHCGVNKQSLKALEKSRRVLGIVSRGGSALASWQIDTGLENPFFAEYDYVLEILSEYDVAMSLGDGMRPGCLHDANDYAQFSELKINAKLVMRSRKAGVQVIVEGPGHMPLNTIESHVRLMKKLCKGAPYYVLGPLVTDIGAGHDELTASIGGAVAAMAGADFLCYVTPAEHLAFPDVDDVKQGVIAAKLAAHAADVARGTSSGKQDLELSKARAKLNWKKQFSLSLDRQKCKLYRARKPPKDAKDVCSMCGEYCAVKVFNAAKKKR